MGDLNTKKWFVYVGDKHEGPYSLSDVQQKMAQGVVTTQHYVWCDGMPDWKIMTEVPDFGAILSGGAPSPAPAFAASSAATLDVQSFEPQPYEAESPAPAAAAANDGLTTMGKFSMQNAAPAAAATAEVDTGSFATAQAQPQRAQAARAATASAFGSSKVAVADNEKTGDIDPKERKRLEKEARKAAKLAEKERKIREKLEAKEAKQREKQAKLLGVGGAGVSVRGGERFAPKLIKLLVIVLLVAGLGAAYIQGYLNPVLENPMVRSGVDTVKALSRPYLLMAVEKVPALGAIFSPIPSLPDVDPVEYEAMKAAVLSRADVDGGKFGIGLSQEDLLKPRFYVATNLPDGAQIEVYVIGVPETLLNQLSYVSARQATVQQGFVAMDPIDMQGKPVPRGTYRVFVVDSPKQPPEVQPLIGALAPVARLPEFITPGRKAFAMGTYFLGGKKDATYAERLKIYHDNLQKASANELAELKQILVTMQSQLKATMTKFESLRKARMAPPARAAAWQQHDKTWTAMMGQFEQAFQSWSPEFIDGRFFHAKLYGMVKSAGIAVIQVHGKQRQYFEGGAQDPGYDGALAQFVNEAQAALSQLQQGISQVESVGPSPNGMPARL